MAGYSTMIGDGNWRGAYHRARWAAGDAYKFARGNMGNAAISGISGITQLSPDKVRSEMAWFRGQGSAAGTAISQSKTIGAIRSYGMSSVHAGGMDFAKSTFGLQKGASGFGRALGVGFLGLSAYSGYQKGGIGGAAKNVATDFAINYGIGAAAKALGLGSAFVYAGVGAVALTGIIGGLSVATGELGFSDIAAPWVSDHMKKHAKLEMGAPVKDDYGAVASMRQRSLRAIQNSRLNGRSALGNEAALMYSPYYR